MLVENLDIPIGRIGEAAQRIIDCAATESRRRGHGELTSGHLFLGFTQREWNLFAEIVRDADVNPHRIVLGIEQALGAIRPAVVQDDMVQRGACSMAGLEIFHFVQDDMAQH